MLSAGVIGCGGAARGRHLPVIEDLDGLTLTWVCDLDEKRAKSTAREYNVNYFVDSDEALTAIPDVVHVCSPPPTHEKLTVDALNEGAHVLVEKPMAMTVAECENMKAAAENNDRKLSVVHNNLFLGPSRKVMRDVQNGKFGEIQSVTSHLGRERNPGEDREWVYDLHGGAAGEHLPHPIYLVTNYLGTIDDVSVSLKANDGNVVGADIQITDTNDVFGSIQYMRKAPPMKKYAVYGTQKRVSVDLFNYVDVQNDTREPSKASIVTDNLSASSQLLFGTVRNVLEYATYAITGEGELIAPGHYTLIERFKESIENDTIVPISPEEGTKVVRVLEELESVSSSN